MFGDSHCTPQPVAGVAVVSFPRAWKAHGGMEREKEQKEIGSSFSRPMPLRAFRALGKETSATPANSPTKKQIS